MDRREVTITVHVHGSREDLLDIVTRAEAEGFQIDVGITNREAWLTVRDDRVGATARERFDRLSEFFDLDAVPTTFVTPPEL